jgi:uncharacterized membrane protein
MSTASLFRSRKVTSDKLNFDFNTGAETVIRIMPKNRRLIEVGIVLDEVFDDAAAVASIGVQTDNEKFMKEVESKLNTPNEFIVRPAFLDENNQTTIRFYLDAGTSTQGKGTAYINYL